MALGRIQTQLAIPTVPLLTPSDLLKFSVQKKLAILRKTEHTTLNFKKSEPSFFTIFAI